MTIGKKKVLLQGLLIVGGLILVGLGGFFGGTRLDDADKWGSVVSALAALIGLPMTGYGIVLARRGSPSPAAGQQAVPGGQSVAGSTVGGQYVQARNLAGKLRIGPSPAAAAPLAGPGPTPVSPAPPPTPGGQSITGSHIAGSVYQIDGVGDDVDIDR
ncbi:hypothetical protein MCAG_00752 [Micromonospora sp. ATCC 39149]|uniref:Uncharacterized protein n=1 Tax=Micromonospora carbonacea TaxID=47853 RepID=A0A7D5YCQ4_9ACTN|nr:hypothetical protein [Micromonospora sp. ATCC 39149]EEP70425.1 hypothetical protein MCAG_00752 [Micromonospora sp. ATCC 39149]QLJ96835.1 hypothetical protein HZU44_18230 [Micromonospora carbonacea]